MTVRSQKIYKQVNDGDRAVMSKMDSGGSYEDKQMYAHRDLVGSTNIVSDNQGRGFQRHEYFPSGEIWISDQKEEIRTPFQFGSGYYEDSVEMILFGTRWYDVEREVLLSPDSLLVTAPRVLIDQPALGAAYTYAGAAATANIDPTGFAFFSAHQRLEVRKQDQANFDSKVASLMGTGDAGDAAQAEQMVSDRNEQADSQNKAESLLEANALIQIDPFSGEVTLGAPYGDRMTLREGDVAAGDDKAADTGVGQDATNAKGGVNNGDTNVAQGSTSASVGDDDAGSDAGSGSSSDSDSAGSQSDAAKPGVQDRSLSDSSGSDD